MEENNLQLSPFRAYPKIPRLFRTVVVTEKLDGTNASVHVLEDGRVLAGKRADYCTPEKDNFGFARWVKDHEEELRVGLGFGVHFGEWWGAGIQRRYGLVGDDKRFSLFNVKRWTDDVRPKCCGVVPVIYEGPFSEVAVRAALLELQQKGSLAVPGFMKPEGVVVYHVAAGQAFKATIEKDDQPKGEG